MPWYASVVEFSYFVIVHVMILFDKLVKVIVSGMYKPVNICVHDIREFGSSLRKPGCVVIY